MAVLRVKIQGESYTFDTGKLTLKELYALKDETGLTRKALGQAIADDDPVGWGALVWLVWRRAGRDVAFADVDFSWDELEIEGDDEPDPT